MLDAFYLIAVIRHHPLAIPTGVAMAFAFYPVLRLTMALMAAIYEV